MQSINKPRRLNVAETQRAAEYFHPLYLTYLSIVLADEAVRLDLRCTMKCDIIIAMFAMNVATPKGAAKLELWFNKLATYLFQTMDKLKLMGQYLGRVFNSRLGHACVCRAMP
jgi:hypothetical protein